MELFRDACGTSANREQCAIKAWRSAIALDVYRIAAQGSLKEFDDLVDKRKVAMNRMYIKPEPEPVEPYRGFREALDMITRKSQEAI